MGFDDNYGKVLDYVAISEERLIRKKYPYTFPIHSILYCLEYFKIKSLKNINYIFSDWIRIKKWIRSGPSYNYQEFDYIKEKLKFKKKKYYTNWPPFSTCSKHLLSERLQRIFNSYSWWEWQRFRDKFLFYWEKK